MLQATIELRSQGHRLLICAERIGVSYPTMVHQARRMGLAERKNKGRRSGSTMLPTGAQA